MARITFSNPLRSFLSRFGYGTPPILGGNPEILNYSPGKTRRPAFTSPVAPSYDPLMEDPAVFQAPDLRLNNSYDLPTLGASPVQTETNPLNPPFAQMPTPPGPSVPTTEARPRSRGDNVLGQVLKRLAIAGVLGAVGGAPAVQVGGSVADLVGQIRERRKREQAATAHAQARADRQAKADALEAEKAQSAKERNKIIADANKRAADFRETKEYMNKAGDLMTGIRDTFIGKPGTQKILTPEQEQLQKLSVEKKQIDIDAAKKRLPLIGVKGSGRSGPSSGGSSSKGVRAGSIRLPTGAVLSKQAFFSFLDNSPTDTNSILNLTAEDPVASAQLVEWTSEHRARKGKVKAGKVQTGEREKRVQQNQDIANREYAGLVKEQQKGAVHLQGKSDAELRKLAQEHADRVKPAKSQASMNFLAGLNAIAEKLK